METFLTTLHVLAAVSLIVTVLLQRGRGSDMGAMLGGGGSQTVFGARGAGNFLTKLTTGCAVVFMATSLSLAYFATQNSREQIFDGAPLEETAPIEGLEAIEGEPAAGALEEVGEAAAGALEEVGEAAAGTLEAVQDAAAGTLEAAEDAAAGTLEAVDDTATGALEAVEDAAGEAAAP